jgi:hypothetical protein
MLTFLEPSLAPADVVGCDLLERLQLRVARRADAIARHFGGREEPRRIWLRAEQEIFEAEERAGRLRGGWPTW